MLSWERYIAHEIAYTLQDIRAVSFLRDIRAVSVAKILQTLTLFSTTKCSPQECLSQTLLFINKRKINQITLTQLLKVDSITVYTVALFSNLIY